MPGSFLTLLTPATPTALLHVLYGYVVPITVVATWTALAVLDLAHSDRDRRAPLAWCVAVLGVPALGGASYLLFGRRALSGRVAIGVVLGGALLVGASYGLSFALIG